MRRALVAALVLPTALAAAGCSIILDWDDDLAVADAASDGGRDAPPPDAPVDAPVADAPLADADPCLACTPAQTCAYGTCVPSTTCGSSDECQNDTICDPTYNGCVPYDDQPGPPYDEECTQLVVVGVFAPGIQCEWHSDGLADYPGFGNVIGTPTVVDFNFDDDAETLAPSIAFVSTNDEGGGAGSCVGDAVSYGVVRVVDGRTCATQHTIDLVHVIPSSPLALGDITDAAGGPPDGRAEIVAHRVGGGLVAFRYDPASADFVVAWETPWTAAATLCLYAGPSIHDLNDDGLPEVIMGGGVFNGQSGAPLDVTTVGANAQIPVVANLDDLEPELITPAAIWEWRGGVWNLVTSALGGGNFVAVADFGTYGASAALDDRATRDGLPEIAIISTGQARLVTTAGRTIYGPVSLEPAAAPGTGGPPTIADFDDDGRAEFAVAGRGAYNVFDPDCLGTPTAATCPTLRGDGLLWTMPTQDFSSSVTGSSVFDFEGDGKAEVVYADECFSRVYDGASGTILYSAYRTSCTWYENPIVADVDGDYNSEIVVPSNSNCSIACPTLDPIFDGLRCTSDEECPGTTSCGLETPGDLATGRCRCVADADCGGNGYVCRDPIAGPSPVGRVCRAGHPGVDVRGVRVVRDSLDRWVDSRPVWNQHAYSVTNVTPSGGIPSSSMWTRNWSILELNNYRQNIVGAGEASASPDMTGGSGSFACEGAVMHLAARVCNRGTQSVGSGIPVAFYATAAAPANLICVATTAAALDSGECVELTCDWATAPTAPTNIVIVVDDDGTGAGANSECHEGNNQATVAGASCVVEG